LSGASLPSKTDGFHSINDAARRIDHDRDGSTQKKQRILRGHLVATNMWLKRRLSMHVRGNFQAPAEF
jgi:hypothetical protein